MTMSDKGEGLVERLRQIDETRMYYEPATTKLMIDTAAARIEALSAKLKEAEAALEPFGQVYDEHLDEHDVACGVGGYVPLEEDFPIDGVHLRYFRAARLALRSIRED